MVNTNNVDDNPYFKKLQTLYNKEHFLIKFEYNKSNQKIKIFSNEIFTNCSLQTIIIWKSINEEIMEKINNIKYHHYFQETENKDKKIILKYGQNEESMTESSITLDHFLSFSLNNMSITALWASYFQILYDNNITYLKKPQDITKYFPEKFPVIPETNKRNHCIEKSKDTQEFYYNLQYYLIYEKIILANKRNIIHEKKYISTIYCLIKNVAMNVITFIINSFSNTDH